ncbi:MAG: P1 family peptidase [Candidatus Aminicenantes bacterium]|nr:P1 family peptidase [Candidatus Aminicenantes bacterium]
MANKKIIIFLTLLIFTVFFSFPDQKRFRARELGIRIGVLNTGKFNSITDVKRVKVGHTTIIKKDNIRTGVTVIIPHENNIFQNKIPAAIYVANGFGKLTGYTQVEELGNIETPIVLTNTLSVWTAADALIDYTLRFNVKTGSVNPVVGETNDGWLNDIRNRSINKQHILKALESAKSGEVEEGSVGAGTGTLCLGFKGGIGTSSRILPKSSGMYTVGVLVQSNFGGILRIDGIPVGIELNNYYFKRKLDSKPRGSCMIIVATDAPLRSRNLKRLAKRAMLGFGKIGGISSNGSGDYVIAFSTHLDVKNKPDINSLTVKQEVLPNNVMSPLFLAVIEATEEAILNSLLKATTIKGKDGHISTPLPIEKLKVILKKYNKI